MRPFPALVVLLVQVAPAQPPADSPPPEAARRAVETWLESPRREELRDRAATAVLDAGRPALRWLGDLLHTAEDTAEGAGAGRLRALESLTAAVGLDFIARVEKSEMFFAGQYDDLRALQPYIGNLYLNLLLDTPDWFAEQRRVLLIPALRDLYPSSPGADVLRDVREIAEHEELEAWNLRLALFGALAQWGDRELMDRHLRELTDRAARADAEDRVEVLRTLAQTHHVLRDHRQAARVYVELLRGAEREGLSPPPVDYYNAACNLSLTGDLEAALDELERCVERMRSGTVDPSQMLERRLFERDPEIANVRKTRRFAALMEAAFPPKKVER